MRNIAAIVPLTIALAGCETVTLDGISWKADLDSMPERACVEQAAGRVTGVAVVADDKTAGEIAARLPAGSYVVALHVDPIAVPRAPFLLDLRQEPGHPTFALRYVDSERFRDHYDNIAQALIASVSQACGVPELARRAHETHDSTTFLQPWAPV